MPPAVRNFAPPRAFGRLNTQPPRIRARQHRYTRACIDQETRTPTIGELRIEIIEAILGGEDRVAGRANIAMLLRLLLLYVRRHHSCLRRG